MPKCSMCSSNFTEGTQCSICKNHFDFNCANVSEAGWKRLGAERRGAWKCASCKTTSPVPPTVDQVSLECILMEVRDIKLSLHKLPMLFEDVKTIKGEIQELKASCEFTSVKLEDFTNKLAKAETSIKEFELKQASLEVALGVIQSQAISTEQRSRLNNVEIKGVPQKKDENLFQIIDKISAKVGYTFPKTQINYISRIPTFNSKDKTIIVSFINRYVKEEFIASARALKTIMAEDLGFQGTQGRIFINDHLTTETKQLLNKVRQIAKDKCYNYVWVKFAKIHIRKNELTQSFIINKLADLNRII